MDQKKFRLHSNQQQCTHTHVHTHIDTHRQWRAKTSQHNNILKNIWSEFFSEYGSEEITTADKASCYYLLKLSHMGLIVSSQEKKHTLVTTRKYAPNFGACMYASVRMPLLPHDSVLSCFIASPAFERYHLHTSSIWRSRDFYLQHWNETVNYEERNSKAKTMKMEYYH